MFQEIGKDLLTYLKNPTCIANNKSITIKRFISILMLFYLFLLPCSLFNIILQVFNVLPSNSLNSLDSSLNSFFYAVLLAPALEELVFRLHLRISKFTFAVGISFFLVVLIKLLFLELNNYIIYTFSIPFFIILFLLLKYQKILFQRLENFWHNNFRLIFYLISFLFGALHLLNYEEIYWWMIILIPVITLPFIMMGLLLGFIRMNYGFAYALILHMIVNFIGSTPLLVKLFMN